jgi:hypothetical protein
MATIQDLVRPGDVISSDLLNRIIALLNEHDVLLATGGSGGTGSGQLLTGFSPPLEQNVNRTLTVFGNFDFPLTTNALSIDGVPISPTVFLPGSNNLQLLFRIPTTIPVPAGSRRPVLVRLVNSRGSDQRPYTLLPEVPGLPDPVITEVRDTATSSTTVRSAQEARIVGQNFASPPANNVVQFTLNPGPQQHSFTLVVKAGSTGTTLLVDMPALTDADGVAIGDSAPGTLSVTVPGANSPAVMGLSIERTA